MKRGTKITLIVLAIIIGIIGLLFIAGDIAVSNVVNKQVQKALTQLPPEIGQVECGPAFVRLFSGTAEIKDLHYVYHHPKKVNKKDAAAPGIEVHVDKVDIGHVFYTLLFKKEVILSDISIVRPSVELWLDDKNPKHSFPELPEDTAKKDQTFPLAKAGLMAFRIKNASMRYHSLRTPLEASVDSLSLTVHDLFYDSTFHYCDSVYAFSLGHAAVTTPDGMMHIDTRNIKQEDQGPLTIGPTHLGNTISPKQMADEAQEPITWADVHIQSVKVAAFNPVRKVLKNDWHFAGADAVVKHVEVYRDETHKPKKPYDDMPQKDMLASKTKFLIDRVNADVKSFHVSLAITDTKVGQLDLKNMKAKITNINNRPNQVMHIEGGLPIEDGKASVLMELIMNKQCDFVMNIAGQNVPASFINTFIEPIAGIRLTGVIDNLDSRCNGNVDKATGSFCLQYHDIELEKNQWWADAANAIIPKNNPDRPDAQPRAYKTEWKHDTWYPFPFYIFGTVIDGAKMTFLPGLYNHKLIRQDSKSGK